MWVLAGGNLLTRLCSGQRKHSPVRTFYHERINAGRCLLLVTELLLLSFLLWKAGFFLLYLLLPDHSLLT